ncbi:cell wall metabolism sensor histidine kinase WalK [bacterium]|nr:cell wall metabolism sensor histidine kinase WalK [bacterium]
MKAPSLRWRILLPPLGILVVFAAFLTTYIPQQISEFETNSLEKQRIAELQQAATAIEAEWPSLTANQAKFTSVADEWSSHIGAVFTILSPTGKVLGGSENTGETFSIYRSELLDAAENGLGSARSDSHETTANMQYIAVKLVSDDEFVGFVHLSYSIPPRTAHAEDVRNILFVSFSIFAVAAMIPLIYITSRSGKRLNEITNATNQIAGGDHNVQIPIGPKDEIGSSAFAINQLARRLKEQFQILAVEQAKINAVLLHMNEGVMILDAQGRIVVTNRSALELFQIEDEAIIGRRIIRVIRYHQIHDLWQEYMDSGKDQAELIELSDQNKLIQVSLTPLNESVQGHSLIVFQDLTQIRQLQTIRRDFVSNISHELRTPLASLKALAETLQISALDDPEAARRFLARMDTEIEALAQMVSELLELSRIESGQVPLNLERTEANKVLASVIERLAVQAERANLSLKAHYTDEPNIILADTPRLEQVLVNIIHNAIKFTPPEGKIRGSIQARDQWIIFKIKDNGEGIPQEDLPRIFERFYKSRRPHSKSGTGLGLSIAKHLVEAHGGKIWVESQLGKGTTFHIALPKQT